MLDNKRILLIRLSSIGDVLHATPVAKALKSAAPSCHVTWIVGRTAANLLETNPYIDRVLVWSREDFEAAAAARRIGRLRQLWRQLQEFYQRQTFDIALDVHGLFLTGAMLSASRTPRRIGMAGTRELNRFFMTEQAPRPAQSHVIHRYLSVLQPLQIPVKDVQMTLEITPPLQKFAADFLRAHCVDPAKKLLFINPQTSWPSKNWGVERFARCAELLDESIQILLCGSAADRPRLEAMRKLVGRPLLNIAGQTTLTELGALLQAADLLLTGDTGALHIATAVKTPTVSLWGPTRPERYGPLQPGHIVLCSPFDCVDCHKTACRLKTNGCLRAIRPETVAAAIHKQLRARK